MTVTTCARRKMQFYLCNPCVPLAILLVYRRPPLFSVPRHRDISARWNAHPAAFLIGINGGNVEAVQLPLLRAGEQVRKRPRSDQNGYRDVKRRRVESADTESPRRHVGQIRSNEFERSSRISSFPNWINRCPEMCESISHIILICASS